MLTDSHCHLTFDGLSEDLPAVLQRSRDVGVTRWITIGTDGEHCARAVALAEGTDNLFAGIGIHPHEAAAATDEDFDRLEQWCRSESVVAVGETGLDFHYDFSPRRAQQEVFRRHLELACRVDLPVVIHTREAFAETLAILDEYAVRLRAVVLHCFTGTADQARLAMERGYMVSFSGAVTFKNAETIRQAACVVPVERMLVETDSPYLSPAPMRKVRPNEPSLMIHTAECLAALKGLSLSQFSAVTWKNTSEIFGLDGADDDFARG